jgi:molybdate transport system substrate-binding protein
MTPRTRTRLNLLSAALLLTIALAPACRATPAALTPTTPGQTPAVNGSITVHAAASLNNAFQAIGRAFTSDHPGTEVVFNFAGSNQLAQQIVLGAPADVFAPASEAQLTAVVADGRIAPGTPRTFATNRLVVVYPPDNPGGLQTLQDLARPGLRLVLATEAVPVGKYALDFLDKAAAAPGFGSDFRARVLNNVVSYEESVRSVLGKVVLGEADAAIVYTSDTSARVGQIEIPDNLNTVATYPIAPISDSANPDLARAFIDFVLSGPGQAILEQHGFLPPR